VSFVCFQCQSRYPVNNGWCSICLESGTILIEPIRPRAAMRGELQSASARDLVKRSWSMVESSAYPDFVVGRGGIVAAYGAPGAGKSTFATKWLDGIDGAVVYGSFEERLGPTVGSRLSRLGVHRADFHVVGQGSVDELVGLCRDVKARGVVIDSINVTTLQPSDLRRFVESSRVMVLLFVLQVTKENKAAGSNAFLHEADVVLQVSESKCLVSKSRYQATPVSFATSDGGS